LEYDTITLGQLGQFGELVGGGIGFESKAKPNPLKANRDLLADAERATKVEVTLGLDVAPVDRDAECRGDGSEGDGRTGDQGLEQHIAGTGFKTGAARSRMEAGFHQGTAGFDPAGQSGAIYPAGGRQRDQGLPRLLTVALLERGLEGSQCLGVHSGTHDVNLSMPCLAGRREMSRWPPARRPPRTDQASVRLFACSW
jgi:hypothetical protein